MARMACTWPPAATAIAGAEIGRANHTWLRSPLTERYMRDPCLRQGQDGTSTWSGPPARPTKASATPTRGTWFTGAAGLGAGQREESRGQEHLGAETFYDAAKQPLAGFLVNDRRARTAKPAARTTTASIAPRPRTSRRSARRGCSAIRGSIASTAPCWRAEGKFLLILKDERAGPEKPAHLHGRGATRPLGTAVASRCPSPGRMVEGPSGG